MGIVQRKDSIFYVTGNSGFSPGCGGCFGSYPSGVETHRNL